MEKGSIFCNRETTCKHCIYHDKVSINVIDFQEDQKSEDEFKDSFIVFVLKGEFEFSYGDIYKQFVKEGKLFVIPLGMRVHIHSLKKGQLCFFPINGQMLFCKQIKLENIEDESTHSGFLSMDINSMVNNFLSSLIVNMENGIRCKNYFDAKQFELFKILYHYYPRPDFVGLFAPLLSGDAAFKSFVLENYSEARTVKELAQRANLSTRTFHDHFKRILGVSPYLWMNRERAKQIRHELIFTDKPIKQICEDFGFTSVSYFNEFCKKNLDNTPAKLRKERFLDDCC